MNYLTLALRLIHIIGGVFWVGSALLMNFFIGPTLRATGDAGRQFAGHFMARTKFTSVMNASVYATLIAGFWLYGIDSQWFSSPWMHSSVGIGFGIGAGFALVGFVTGFMNGANNRKLAALGSQIQGKPTPEQAAQLAAVQKQQGWVVPVNTWTLLLAVFFMATARYLVF
ncbi:MAG: hypothetical protein C3F07_06580 [Anaerolineales bacterium]|nr:MAG: hypothetical protein C3F07_06580 [Anaerolineales bacterium]